ncbi:MAG: LysR substrate-binding domain-containing protein [Myxococcota bacterium]
MNRDPLAGLDLNLLVVFRAVHRERSVRAAARSLGLSPSAASHALGRLRDLAGDELFVRRGARMVPTPRAEALAGPVSRALQQVSDALVVEQGFEPARAEGALRVAAVDLAQALLLPSVLAEVAVAAPSVCVRVVQLPEEPAKALLSGEVDLAVAGPVVHDAIARDALWTEPFVCVVRPGHPCLAEPAGWTAERYAALPHVLVQPRGTARGHVDRALAAVGLHRSVRCVTPGLDLAARVVASSDLVLTTTARGASLAVSRYGLTTLPPPLAVEPYVLSASFREQRVGEPLLRWFRSVLLTHAAS